MEQIKYGSLPSAFVNRLRELGEIYLRSDDPLKQSGFTGGSERWRCEREPILGAIADGGDFIDTCCANGYLLECLQAWGKERGQQIAPFGIDQSLRLIDIAKRRMPKYADHFQSANAWDWRPPRRYRYVYTLWDCVPEDYLSEFVRRLIESFVAPGGRLIIGAYGSLSRKEKPFDVETFLSSAGYRVSGSASSGDPAVARFAWIDRAE
jgi:hypothetical protein